MAATEFITMRFPDGEMPKTQTRTQMLERIRTFLKGPARLRQAGGEWGPWRTEADAVARVRDLVDRQGVGPKLIIQRESDRDMLSIREITAEPDLGAAPAIEEIHYAVWDKFDVRSGGLWLCRYIDGTRTVSKHGYQAATWKGAAEDIFVLDGGMAELVRVGEFIVAQTRAKKLDAATVIVDNDIWTSSGGWRVYGGNRHFHVHTDVVGGTACRP